MTYFGAAASSTLSDIEHSFDITYPSIRTEDSADVLVAFGPTQPPSAIPSTIPVDRHGRIAARIIGATTASTLRTLLEDLLDEPTP